MMREVFSDFIDKDSSFVREFQTGGFSARVFELAIFAYFREKGVRIDSSHPAPDFLTLGDWPIAVEVTTTNQPQGKVPDVLEFKVIGGEELENKGKEFVFQIGKAIRRKIQKRDAQGRAYWEMPHVEGRPFLVAVCAFHNQHAHLNPMGAAGEYLYGKKTRLKHDESGRMVAESQDVSSHEYQGKMIPSGLFGHPEASHLSGVVFSNSHTASIFTRIGAERGYNIPNVKILRFGTCFNHAPNAIEPARFSYTVGDRPEGQREDFSEGLHVFANPWAEIKVAKESFPGVPYHEMLPDGSIQSTFGGGFHPFESQTIIISSGNA